MANDFQLLPNPDNVPSAVSSGYERQNTNISTIKTGMDTSSIYIDENKKIILNPGAIIDFNGELFINESQIDLTDAVNNVLVSNDYCFLAFDGTSIEAIADSGSLDVVKNARYTSDNKRILNVVFH